MKKKKNGIYMLLASVPTVYAGICLYAGALKLSFLTYVLILAAVAILPCCRKRENIWLCLLCAVASVPVNLLLLKKNDLWQSFLFVDMIDSKLFYYMCLLEILLFMGSVEEIIVGIIGRFLWPRQYRILDM